MLSAPSLPVSSTRSVRISRIRRIASAPPANLPLKAERQGTDDNPGERFHQENVELVPPAGHDEQFPAREAPQGGVYHILRGCPPARGNMIPPAPHGVVEFREGVARTERLHLDRRPDGGKIARQPARGAGASGPDP